MEEPRVCRCPWPRAEPTVAPAVLLPMVEQPQPPSDDAPPPPRILVIGAGPAGLEAAVALELSGFSVTVIERGEHVGQSVRDWGHCRLFTTNHANCSSFGLQALEELGVARPAPNVQPTGMQFCDHYLEPMARYLLESEHGCEVLCSTNAISLGRAAGLKGERDRGHFSCLVAGVPDGEERILDGFSAVVDCTGTYGNGNSCGRGGMAALGERALRRSSADHLRGRRQYRSGVLPCNAFFDGLPDVKELDAASFLPRPGSRAVSLAVVGSGYGAATTLSSIIELAASRENLYEYSVHWFIRSRRDEGEPFAKDVVRLPAMAKLAERLNLHAVHTSKSDRGKYGRTPTVHVHRGSAIDSVKQQGDAGSKLVVTGTREPAADPNTSVDDTEAAIDRNQADEPFSLEVDTFVSQCGYRPHLELAREMAVRLDDNLEAPMMFSGALNEHIAVAAELHGASPPEEPFFGPDHLVTDEPGYYILGSKSFGRNSGFFLQTAHQQAAMLATMLREQLFAPEGSPEEHQAATKVQALVRGNSTRRHLAKQDEPSAEQHAAATKVQAMARGRNARKHLAEAKVEATRPDVAPEDGAVAAAPFRSTG